MSSVPAIPDHTLLRPIGRGAYGEVWLARNVMGALRAVKVIWRRQFESDRPYQREFSGIQRYEPVSRSSGGLVHVLQVGRNDAESYFYYVMELADDVGGKEKEEGGRQNDPAAPACYAPRTLRSDLKRLGRLPTAECLRLAIDVASGLGQLHRHGLVHRDVKPGNIIYVNGRAKLADIGLVTTSGEGRTFVGTEGYIPPEGPGSPGADLFALGVVLYEASTGFAPERLPDVPSEWLAEPGGDEALELHEIILKASEGERPRRYENVEALQADLAVLRSGHSVRRVRALERRYARLRLSGVVGTTLLVLSIMTALIANYRSRLDARNHAREVALRQSAQRAEARAETAERSTRRELQSALYEQARALVLSRELGHRTAALQAIRQAAGATNAAELRRVAFAALSLPDLRLERELRLPSMLTLVRLDPRFERIALSGPGAPVTICAVSNLQVLATLPPTTRNTATVAQWSADGRFLAIKRQDPRDADRTDMEVWRVGQTQLVFSVRDNISLNSFSFHPRLPRLLAGDIRGLVNVWDLRTARPIRAFHLPGRPFALAYSPHGKRFAASYWDGSKWLVAFHDASSGAALCSADCRGQIGAIAWDPSGRWVSVAGVAATEWNRNVWLIATDTGAMTVLGRHKIKTSEIVFNPDGNYLLSSGWDRELICWDLRTRQPAFTVPGVGWFQNWDANGRQCATLLGTDRPRLYAFEPPACLELAGNRGGRLRPGAFSPDARWLAVPDGLNLCVWDLARHSAPVMLAEGGGWQPFFSPDGRLLFAVSGAIGAAHLRAWRLGNAGEATERRAFSPLPIAQPPRLNWAAPDGTNLVLTCAAGVRFVGPRNFASGQGREVEIPSGQGSVSPDGRWLAVTYSFSPIVRVYRLPEVKPVARLRTSGLVGGVWFSPEGDELTIINRGGVEFWDTRTWRRRGRQPGLPISDADVLYTPDGRDVWRVTSFRDATLYDRATGRPLLPLPPDVLPLALSADGRKLAVGVDEQRVQVWDLVQLRARFKALGLDW
jgi:serine/threonine protein kinase/WD40 repeat protein